MADTLRPLNRGRTGKIAPDRRAGDSAFEKNARVPNNLIDSKRVRVHREAIRAAIVHDERLAREHIERLLADEEDFKLVATCSHGDPTASSVRIHNPEVLFVDTQIPEIEGMALIEPGKEGRMPVVVFVKTFERFTMGAFEVLSCDSALRSLDKMRFRQVLDQVRRQLEMLEHQDEAERQAYFERLMALLRQRNPSESYLRKIAVRVGDRVILVDVQLIDWIEAAGNYVTLHVNGRKNLLRSTMADLMKRLDPQLFVRIHRSAIVNIERIQELRPHEHGEYVVMLRDGTELRLTRTYRADLEALLGGFL